MRSSVSNNQPLVLHQMLIHLLTSSPRSRFCNACRSDIMGFGYHCCAKLPVEISDGETRMFLHRRVWCNCYKCGRSCWSYRSRCKEYSLHVPCVREMVVEGWMREGMLSSSELGLGLLDGGGDGGGKKGRKMEVLKRGCEVALQIVISAVLGDPSAALLSGVSGSFM